ncbi:MAG: hypothetical protein M0002_04940 [Rhodospirillales bacterium]|nr:hypothetical protein [Rhodospirillales bacterium]
MRKVLLMAGVCALGALAYTLPAAAAPVVTPEHLTVYILPGRQGLPAPNGHRNDSYVPSSFVLKKGVPAVIRVINYDDGLHSMYAPGLGVNTIMMPGKHVGATLQPTTTTFTVTPTKTGLFRWQCTIPCDGGINEHWAMSAGFDGHSQVGYMAGFFVVR